MLIFNLHYQLALRISGNMQHKTRLNVKFPLYLKKAGLASRNIVHHPKKFYVVSVSTFTFFIIYHLGEVGAEDFRLETVKFS